MIRFHRRGRIPQDRRRRVHQQRNLCSRRDLREPDQHGLLLSRKARKTIDPDFGAVQPRTVPQTLTRQFEVLSRIKPLLA